MKEFIVGIDVGGTNIKGGLIDHSGRIISRTHLLTRGFIRNKKKLIDAIILKISDLIKKNHLTKNHIAGIGLGLPGLIDVQRGIVNFLPNIPGWRNVPLKNLIQNRLHIPTFIDNDVNLVTLGEWKFGAGRGYSNLICLTLGTGVGGGVVLNNALYRGEGFVAGEIGHMPLNEEGPECNCGGMGCFERYVGNQYLLERARRVFKNKNISLEDIFDMAQQGNDRAVRFWEDMAVHIGNALVGVVNLLNPRLVIIGGGISNTYQFLYKRIISTVKQRAMKVQAKMVKIVRTQLGDDAGIIGAGVLVRDSSIGY